MTYSANPISPPSFTYLPFRCRLLAILGNSEGINLEEDVQSLKKLEHMVEIEWLEEPSRRELYPMLWRKKWDILFFAGHSSSEEDLTTGNIAINSQDSLNLQQLRNTLRNARQNGLKLAIFNSCDGLGLANALVDLRIPYIIVMREPVPDQVAQDFLEFFLERFSKGMSLHKAFRKAREQLEYLEHTEYPGATLIPEIVQHPTAQPLFWSQDPTGQPEQTVTLVWWKQYRKIALATVLLLGLIASALAVSPYSEFLCEPIGNCNVQVTKRSITKTLEQVNDLNNEAQSIANIETALNLLHSIEGQINTLRPEDKVYKDYFNLKTTLVRRLETEKRNQQLLNKTAKIVHQIRYDTNQDLTVKEMRTAVDNLLRAKQELDENIKSTSLFYSLAQELQQDYKSMVKSLEKQIAEECKVPVDWQPRC
ncbi:MAG: CHAT domain-containing protein [Symploca sp. SIO2D2]|nr:CHAT domain-containing protein [Symploca sp. SIO2D2]